MAEDNKGKKASEKKGKGVDERAVLLVGLFVLLLTLFLFLAMFSHIFSWSTDQSLAWENILHPADIEAGNLLGPAGATIASCLITHGFGLAAFLIPLLLFMYGLRILRVRFARWRKRQLLLIFGTVLGSVVLGYLFRGTWGILGYGFGGKFGYFVAGWLIDFMSYVGAGLLLLFVIVAYIIWYRPRLSHTFLSLLQLSGKGLVERTKNALGRTHPVENVQFATPTEGQSVNKASSETPESVAGSSQEEEVDSDELTNSDGGAIESEQEGAERSGAETPLFQVVRPNNKQEELDTSEAEEDTEATLEVVRNEDEEGGMRHFTVDEPYDPTLDLSRYQMPPLSLLEEYDDGKQEVTHEELVANNKIITDAFLEFGITIKSIRATVGPTVTLYEIIPGAGVKVTKIESLEKDLALRLLVLGVRIFMRPGAIGIEVPNKHRAMVSMLSMLRSRKFQEDSGVLPLALGKTVSGEPFVVDLEKMPHLLVAGATGQGKSVGLNVIIASILYKKHPAQVKLVMIDPKKVEFSPYAKIEKHFLAKIPDAEEAIITDSEKVIYTLNSLVQEMESRLALLKDAQVRKISEYNEKFIARRLNPEHGHSYMPRIVVIIDEFADLMMTSSNDVVPPLMRLAQVGRAAGIHLIMATQRPTTDVLVGKIKANIPARIAFRVVSGIDSRTILEMQGAEKLVGNGDMLVRVDSLNVERVQCAFLDTREVARITDFISQQQSYPSAWKLPEPAQPDSEAMEGLDSGELDPLFEDVKNYVVTTQRCSISDIQRKYSIGFTRAGRIVDQLERAHVVGARNGTKERDVLL